MGIIKTNVDMDVGNVDGEVFNQREDYMGDNGRKRRIKQIRSYRKIYMETYQFKNNYTNDF